MKRENVRFSVGLVEDNAKLGGTLRKVIDSSPNLRCIGVWGRAEEALDALKLTRPQAILMDINLPGMSGIEAVANVKAKYPDIHVVMVTAYGDHDQIFAALKAGATGYILKSASPSEVRDAIYDVLSGGAPMSPEIARRLVETFHEAPVSMSEEFNLTPREIEVLDLLAVGLMNKEIAARLEISAGTIRVHLKNIYDKLHVQTRTEAAMKYRDSGRFRSPRT